MGVQIKGRIIAILILLCQAGNLVAHPLRVLVLQSYHKAAWSDSVLAGVKSVLESKPGTEITVEYMDTKRLESQGYLDLLDSLYRTKYSPKEFEAVITVDDPAYRFFLERGQRIWGSIPMAFCGVNRFQDSLWLKLPMVTGVVEKGDFKENLKFALQARPEAKNVWIISDRTSTSLENLNGLLGELRNYPQLTPKVLSDISMDSLKTILKTLPREDFGFFIALWRDKDEHLLPQDSVAALFRHATIPIFGRLEWLMGKGLTGGMCVLGSRQGAFGAMKLLEQLKLSPSERAPIRMDSPNAFIFDYQELERIGIPLDILPKGSRIVNSPTNMIEVPEKTMGIILICLAVIFMLGVLLLLNSNRRLKLSRRLMEKESDYRLLVETQTDLVVKVDMQNRFLFASPSYCKFFHTSEKMLLGHTFIPKVHPDDIKSTLDAMELLKSPPYKVYLEQRVVLPEGIRWLGWNDSAVLDEKGNLVAIIGVGRDITERKSMEAEKEQLIEELKKKNFELERYAYTVSHDLRSPLVTIMGFAREIEMDLATGDNSNLTDYLQRIQAAGTRMNALLEAILHLSRVGRVAKEPESINLRSIFNDVLFSMDRPLKQAGVRVIIEPDEGWPVVLSDKDRLTEIFQNLLENAVKYRGNQVEPLIRIRGEFQKKGIKICVEDNGKGIPGDQLEKIFSLFNKIDPNSSGIGFGLALCKHILEGLGGSIWAESDGEGKGSRFWVRLP